MEKNDWLARNFEEARKRLKTVAYRILGSSSDAEDAVQETWMRLARSDAAEIENLNGWLTTVVARVCLDKLRHRKSKREESLDHKTYDKVGEEARSAEAEFLLADSVGSALLVVLDLLTPAERIAFVLHDLFELSFAEIAPIIDKTEVATRQIASRARQRVKGATAPQEEGSLRQEVVSAFLAASREGHFEALIRLLHPEAVLRADKTAVQVAQANKSRGAPQFEAEIRGAGKIADTFKGKASAAQLALIDGSWGATYAPGGNPVVAFRFSLTNGKISAIEIVMDKNKLAQLQIDMIESR